ncbi:hypothetical protein Ais01nite_46630 [Asanoa ishikariensis]|uniref:DUF4352 domain-containing protein n=1 Tax=Asanoa ishikariensis TaxID=137265 RepID=A0A1H3S1A8_9ACTN|nr:DUF4352 domain-containing protein [Asanoa ishikariensis]GIF66628.1 hypothetical protein Ais01nite_46630 [Asanoa ishikariensis]SDZ31428.1 protein of unknown function [Asanoa ishikariensis]
MRKTTFFALVIGGLLALGCGAGSSNASGGSADSDAAAGSGDSGGSEETAKTAKVGQAARDGKFEFTVKAPKCGVAEVGDKYLNEKAQGQFCLVTVTVKNIGDKPQTFSDSSQKAFGADDVEYSADSGAAIYANKNADTLFTEINPGNKVTGVVVFDIPKKAKLAKLELHDSPFSGGVTVQLG